MNHRKAILSMLLLVGLLLAAPAQARRCFFGANTVAFGTYLSVAPTPLDTTSTITVFCFGRPTGGQTNFYYIHIDGGNSGSPTNRYMSFGTNQLFYNLYKDAARTNIWGDGNGATPLAVNAGNGRVSFNNYQVYGRIPPLQNVSAGVYTDVVDVTIEF